MVTFTYIMWDPPKAIYQPLYTHTREWIADSTFNLIFRQ